MAIQLTGTGGLFTRWGKILGGLNEWNGAHAATLAARAGTTLYGQYASAQQEVLDGLFAAEDAAGDSGSAWNSYLQTLAQNTLVEMADDDVAGGLNPKDLDAAVAELIGQMGDDGQSINRPGVGVSVAAGGSNVGDGVVAATVTDDDGLPSDYVFAEAVECTVTSSAQAGGATAGQETLAVVGRPALDPLDPEWPGGSGVSTSVSFVNAAANTALLSEGSFDGSWVLTNTPPSPWAVVAGTPGTHILRNASPINAGGYALEFVGDGANLTAVRQLLTVASFRPKTTYCLNVWLKRSASLAAGVLRLRLADGSGNTVADAQAADNAFSKTLSTLSSSSWSAFTNFVRTPAVLPEALYLYVELTTAVTSGQSVYIDHVALVQPGRLYAGGPFLAAFSGGTNLALDDEFTVTVTNSGDTGDFTRGLDRLLGLRSLGRKIPSSGAPTIADNLIG